MNLSYLREVYAPLTEAHKEGKEIEGLEPAVLSPMQLAVMSPWMLANRANSAAFDNIGTVASKYLDHWFNLLEKDLQPGSFDVTAESVDKRDSANRSMLFSKEIDPVWNQIEAFIGAETGAQMREILKDL